MVSAIRKTTKLQLKVLDIVGRCNGHSTLDQAWFLYCLTSLDRSITYSNLSRSLDDLVSLGLLTVDSDGKISFKGDEFEQTYIRYHAERAGVSLSISPSPYSVALGLALGNAVESFAGPILMMHAFPGEANFAPVEAVAQLLNPQGGEITEVVGRIYGAVLEAAPCGQLTLVKVTVAYEGVSALVWLSFSADDYIDFANDPNFAQLNSVVQDNNGELSFEEVTFALPPEEQIIDRILASSNKPLVRRLAMQHASTAATEYVERRYDIALMTAQSAARLPLLAESTNNIGYINLAMGQYQAADELFARAASLAARENNQKTAALISYNHAISRLMLSDRAGAVNLLEAVKNLQVDQPSISHPVRCVFIPRINSEKLVIQELKEPELFDTVDQALNILRGLPDSESVSEILLCDDLDL